MNISKAKQTKLDKLLSGLTSAYQENAINSVLEDIDEYENAFHFRDAVCSEYRDVLKGAGYAGGDVYKGFKKYGDETEIDEVAKEIYYLLKPQNTPKAHFNKIVAKALKLNNKLRKLEQEAQELADECKEHADDYDENDWTFNLHELSNVLEDLAGFDLEDAIPDKHTNEY